MNQQSDCADSGETFLEGRLAAVAARIRRGEGACVAFDIDNTMFDTRMRTLHIARSFDQAQGTNCFSSLSLDRTGADARSTCARLGGCTASQEQAFEAYWLQEFWNHARFVHDQPVEPVHAWARRALEVGAAVLFLTGRVEALREATAGQLAQFGFAPSARIELRMKPTVGTNTLLFKAAELAEVGQRVFLAWYVTEGRSEIAHLRRVAPEGPWVLVDCSLEEGGPEVPPCTPVLRRAF